MRGEKQGSEKNMEFTEMQLLLQQEPDKIGTYIRRLILSSDLKECSRLCDHEMLNSILCRYMQQCTDSHITFHADIVPDSFIEINTSKYEKTSFVAITVINSCRKNPFSGKGRQLSTNKTDKIRHGFGLKSIHKTVSKYQGNMQMYYNDDTLTFHTIITLKQQELNFRKIPQVNIHLPR